MLSSLRWFPGASFEGNQRLSSVHHWCISILLSHIIWNQFFSLLLLLFSVLICTDLLWKWWYIGGRAVVMSSAQCVQQFWLGCAFPVPSFPGSSHELELAGVTEDSRWHRAGDDAVEANTCCTCGCSRRCWSQYYKPKPQALWQFTAYLCCAFFFFFSFTNCVQNMRFVSLSWVFLLPLDVIWYEQCEFESSG